MTLQPLAGRGDAGTPCREACPFGGRPERPWAVGPEPSEPGGGTGQQAVRPRPAGAEQSTEGALCRGVSDRCSPWMSTARRGGGPHARVNRSGMQPSGLLPGERSQAAWEQVRPVHPSPAGGGAGGGAAMTAFMEMSLRGAEQRTLRVPAGGSPHHTAISISAPRLPASPAPFARLPRSFCFLRRLHPG